MLVDVDLVRAIADVAAQRGWEFAEASSDGRLELRAARRFGQVRLSTVGHLVARARLQHIAPAVGEFGVQFAFQDQQDMTLLAPVVREIARRVLDHADANVVEGPRAPVRLAGLPGMLGAGAVMGLLALATIWLRRRRSTFSVRTGGAK